MSQAIATKRSATCDDCGAQNVRIARVYKGIRHCPACYKRMFKRRMCAGCGNFAKLHVRLPEAVCQACERLKPCVRCGRPAVGPDKKIGKLTPSGPACKPCAPYFREPEPCEACGEPSIRLSRKATLGHDLRVCKKCARSDHETCQACRHHRPLTESPDGRKLCAACLEKGEIPCPKCRQPMPAGFGKKCWSCYWTETAVKRIDTNREAFHVPGMAKRFADFGAWLIQKVGEHKAALTIHKYLTFFLDIERKWQDIPDYETLLRHFSAAGLRRFLLPIRWMEETGLVTPDAAARETDSDRRRIEASLAKLPEGSQTRMILEDYHEYLMQRVEAGTTTLRSVRLALSPAAALLMFAETMDRVPPDQKALDGFLRQAPGQRAAVAGFVNYLREGHGADIALPRQGSGQAYRNRRKKLEAEMLALMQEDQNGGKMKPRWLGVALAYFHDLPIKTAEKVGDEDVTTDASGMTVRVGGNSYWIPNP